MRIQRGIFRDFPTTFPGFLGLNRIEAPFEVREVRRDGDPEPYALERIGGPWGRAGVRVRIGDADVFLQDGVHTYTIRYDTERWMGFGDAYDELYWNVTGNGWDFPILRASARVRLPRSVDPADVELNAWTGEEGSEATNATREWDPGFGGPVFETTRPLGFQEGLTISVVLPKGAVLPPDDDARSRWLMADWGPHIQALIGVLAVLCVYVLLWFKVGVDPARSSRVVRYEPPDGYSPAAMGYLAERGWKDRLMSSALVSLAVQGALRIEKDGDDDWKLRRAGDGSIALAATEERKLFEQLLGSKKVLDLESSSHASRFRTARKQLISTLKRRIEKTYFVLNRRWFAVGLGVSVLTLVLLAILDPYGVPFPAWFLMFWLSMWTIGAGTLFIRCLALWRTALTGGGAGAFAAAGAMTLFSTPFFIAEIVVGGFLLALVPRALAMAAVLLGLVNVVFYHLLERPTMKGRGVLDHIEGFLEFLSATDADRMNRMMPMNRTPELFEKYLPHAIALGVENRWAEQFEDSLPSAAEPTTASGTRSSSNMGGALGWYAGGTAAGFTGLASALGGSFSSSLSSASSPPSSSGSGGGGFSGGGGSSGGGGGGGGGGGW
ncbi:MAG: DUF2207 domain-containing protein [Gemmatimonadetes bacterium]|nr:DUF2207 domain-containing protein [Gemmatimonadota bacterium]